MKTFIKFSLVGGVLAFLLFKAYSADITPGYTAPFQNGQTINAATLNQALAGNVNGTFYTGKSAETALDASGDLFLVYSTANSAFMKVSATNAFRNIVGNTNMIGGLNGHTLAVTNSSLVMVFDPVTPEVYKITIQELLTNTFRYDHAQFGYNSGLEFSIASGANITNASLITPTVNGGTLTNSITSNSFGIYGSTTATSVLKLFDSGATAGSRAWSLESATSQQLTMTPWNDAFSASGSAFFIVTRQTGNTNIQTIAFNATSNGVAGVSQQTPSGFQIGASGTPVAQINTYDSGTNVVWPSAAATITNAHGFPLRPTSYRIAMVCTNADAATSWVAGDEVDCQYVGRSGDSLFPFFQTWCDNTNIYIQRSNSGLPIIQKKANGTPTTITAAVNWTLHIVATYIK